MGKSVILSGVRTPFGKLNGALAAKSGVELGGVAIAAAIERAGIERTDVQHVVMGQVLQGGAGAMAIGPIGHTHSRT